MFKVGDYVKSEKLSIEGVVNWTGICYKRGCMEPVFTLEKKDDSGIIVEFHEGDFEQIQRVWRTLSEISNGFGYYVWEVMEVVGDATNYPSYIECEPQESYVLAWCAHFFTKEKAEEYLNSDDGFNQKIIIIPEKKED